MTTKERILEEALTLFAQYGYDGTGVDLIAKRVGIKGPSLYKHFKGKEDILNTLIDNAEVRYEDYFGSEKHIGKIPQSKEEFIRTTMGRIAFTMKDPMIQKIRKFLVQEQFRNDRLAEITTRHKGLFDKDDPALLATELTSPVVLWIAKADRQPQYEQEIIKSIEEHLQHFCKVYMKE